MRSSRASALADAEGFHSVIHALELLGQQYSGECRDLGFYTKTIACLAAHSPLATEVPEYLPIYHNTFGALYEELRQARNDAIHQGAYARSLTGHAVDISIILEDALMPTPSSVGNLMVRDVTELQIWHPVSYVRQIMLKQAFSYLPLFLSGKWTLIPEYEIGRYLRAIPPAERKKRLLEEIGTVITNGKISALSAKVVTETTSIKEVLKDIGPEPILVVDKKHTNALVGILTASDIL